jgi:hypothetical protein
MKPEYHLFVSAALASGFYLFTGSVWGSILAFAGGFLIDIDHFFDFWLYKKRITYTSEFFTNHFQKSGHIIVIFHSIELLWLVYLAQVLTASPIVLGLAAGMTVHMLMDLFGNRDMHPLGYFFMFRYLKKFNAKKIAPGATN